MTNHHLTYILGLKGSPRSTFNYLINKNQNMKKIMLTEKETRAFLAAGISRDYVVKGILVDHGLIADTDFTYENIGKMGVVMLNLTNVITMGEHVTR